MSNWISVEDKLPKKLEKVLFACVHDEHLKNIYMGYLCDAGWDVYLPYDSFKLSDEVTKVTHWMELPDYPEVFCKHDSDGFCYYKSGIKCTDFLVYACSESPCLLKCKICGELFDDRTPPKPD